MIYYRWRGEYRPQMNPYKKVFLWIIGVWLGLSILGVLVMGDGPSAGMYVSNRSERIVVACVELKNGHVTMQRVEQGERQYLAYPAPELVGKVITLLDKENGQVLQRIRIARSDLRDRFHTFTYEGKP